MKLRIYTDTSVIGGCLDPEFQVASVRLVERFKLGEAVIVLSELTRLELVNAPNKVRDVLKGIPEEHREYLDLTTEAKELAERYFERGRHRAGKAN